MFGKECTHLTNGIAIQPHAFAEECCGYLPVIASPLTRLDVVYTLLTHSAAMANELRLDSAAVVLDQAVYCKALEVMSFRPEEFKTVVLRLGAFHTCCAFLAAIGSRLDACIRDLFVEGDVLGTGSMDTLLAGKHYNRGVRCHKLVLETLQRLKLLAFKERRESAGKTWHQHTLVQAMSEFCSGLSFNSRTSLKGLPAMQKLFRDHQEFCSQLTSSMAQLLLSTLNAWQ